MTEFLTFDLDATFRSLQARMQEEGVFDKEAYDDLVDEVLEEKRELGELDDDNDLVEYAAKLKARWPEAEASLTSGHETDVLEQE